MAVYKEPKTNTWRVIYDKTAMDAYKESSQAFSVLFSDPKKYAALKSVLAEIMYREFCQM